MRFTLAILFAILLFGPIGLRWVSGREDQTSPPKDALELVIISPHVEPIKREFSQAFSDYHQRRFGRPVYINFLTIGGGGGADMRRTFEARRDTLFARTGTYDIDLAWGGGDTLFDRDLKPHLQGLALDPQLIRDVYPQPTLGGLRLYEGSDPPLWYGTALSSFGIAYNVDLVKYLGTGGPKTWADLKDPRYRGWVLAADPTRSATARTMFMVIVERAMADAEAQGRSADIGWAEGMGLVRQIVANVRGFNDNASSVPSVISSGDAAAAMMIDFYARSQIQFVGADRMGYIEPADATVINPDPIGMIRGAPHPELARRFVEFVLSEQGQRLFNLKAGLPGGPKLSSLRRLPVRRSVYADMAGFTDPVNPFEQTTSFNTSRARTRTFDILGELIQASCMDLLDELKATRAVILASPKAAELDAKLGTFPFDQQEALKRSEQYRNASPVGKLELMRTWTSEFREEYRQLRRMAQQ